MAKSLIAEFETHAPLADAGVKIDFMFAFPDFDESTGEPTNDALTKNGVKALGITRKLPPKDRAKGLGDAEVCLDGYWWDNNDEDDRRALLDHELHHIAVTAKRDDLGRPILKMRKHDVEIGWFHVVAQRHGSTSQERRQAKIIFDCYGQYYWPDITTTSGGRFAKLETAAVQS